MARLQLTSFADEHLDAAAELLAERHRRHRAAEPLLPANVDFRAEVEALWRRERASGAVALRDGRPVGYLIGAPRPGDTRGRDLEVEVAGHAAEEAETVRDLYAAAAEAWVAQGRTSQQAMVPASDAPLVDAWFRLGFGQQHVYGIREVPADVDVSAPSGVELRRAGPEDLDAVVALDPVLWDHQLLSPVFSGADVPSPDETRDEWKEELENRDFAIFLAARDGRPLGSSVGAPIEYSASRRGVARPERACILGFAATVPDARGTGVGVALTNAVFAWARDEGFRTIVVDWRETNLLSSRFWPRRGFRRAFLRLHRSIP